MEESNENEKERIKNIIYELSEEYDKLIMANPYLLKVLSKKYINNSINPVGCDINEVYKKFRKHNIYRIITLFIYGFSFCSILLAILFIVYKDYPFSVQSSHEVKLQTVFSFVFQAMPIIISFFSVCLGGWALYLREIVNKEDFFNTRVGWSILLILVVGVLPAIAVQNMPKNELLLFICPLLGYIVVLYSFIFIYNPLSSRKLNNTIIDKTEQILRGFNSLKKSIDSLNKSNVQNSHLKVLKRIEQVEETIENNDTKVLPKIHALTVLDSLRLELIKNSINGINLVPDWKYLDLSQKMMEEIMSDKNEKITVLGDLSFLSTKDGLDKLVTAIKGKQKIIEIYFTGEKVPNEKNTIVSTHCSKFVETIRDKYKNIHGEIKDKVFLKPIPSESFTGIGFIGLRDNDDDNDNHVYKKVYAYISSLLFSEDNIDITRANPFVFSWDYKLTYFSKFLESRMVYDGSLKVKIGDKIIPATDLLKFNEPDKHQPNHNTRHQIMTGKKKKKKALQ